MRKPYPLHAGTQSCITQSHSRKNYVELGKANCSQFTPARFGWAQYFCQPCEILRPLLSFFRTLFLLLFAYSSPFSHSLLHLCHRLFYRHSSRFLASLVASSCRLRFNSNGYDLNRNFPDYFKTNNKKSQVETEAVKAWLNNIQFVLSAQLHGGALVASYPFDNTPNAGESPGDGLAVRGTSGSGERRL